MEGLTVECEECEGTIRVRSPEKPPPSPPKQEVPIVVEQVSSRELMRSVGLIAGLAIAVIAVFVFIIWAVSPSKPTIPTTPTTTSTTPTTTNTPKTIEIIEAERKQIQSKQRAVDEFESREKQVAGLRLLAGGFVVVVLVVVVVVAYTALVFFMGWWVARDASTRGMPTLGWMASYYFFHFSGALLAVPSVTILVFIPVLGWVVGGFLWFAISWNGLLMYLYVRRPGRMMTCSNCSGQHLRYLLKCPHCEATVRS
jgi:hypothetical protein